MSILTLLIILPLIGAIILAFLPSDDHDDIRGAAMVASGVTFVVSLVAAARFKVGGEGFQLGGEAIEWIPALGASFSLGVDGVSLVLVLLTALLMPLTILSSWKSVTTRTKEFHICLLVLEATMIAVLCARDMLLFYVFWEAMLIPMFLLIGVFGSEDRIVATRKFFIYTAAGSLMMLAGILYVYNHKNAGSFDIAVMQEAARSMSMTEQYWLLVAFALAFAIKVPLFPLHTWLPHAHVQAPAAGSVQLAAVMLKMGGYGFLRFAWPFFPGGWEVLQTPVMILAVIGVVYGACMALAQDDLKRLIAYSSVSHLALVVLGLISGTSAGITGAIYQMLAHGLSTGGLFLLVGMLYERRHSRDIDAYGGLARQVPWLTTMFIVTTLASIAVPGTCGFIGEFLILIGVYQAFPAYVVFAAGGVVLGAAYMLKLVKGVFFGELSRENADMEDLTAREWCVLLPVVSLMLVLGLFPGPILGCVKSSVESLL